MASPSWYDVVLLLRGRLWLPTVTESIESDVSICNLPSGHRQCRPDTIDHDVANVECSCWELKLDELDSNPVANCEGKHDQKNLPIRPWR